MFSLTKTKTNLFQVLLPLALLPCLVLSLPQRSADWHTSYAGDSVHYASPVDPGGGGGGGGGTLDVGGWRHSAPPVSRGSQWQAAFSPDPVVMAAHRRQFQEEEVRQ